ncbi:MAG: hypothetical protein JWP08_1544, partial [Bryobacterales bacterium]|nr:hypothetical protein [Bryobacterales bacterium]
MVSSPAAFAYSIEWVDGPGLLKLRDLSFPLIAICAPTLRVRTAPLNGARVSWWSRGAKFCIMNFMRSIAGLFIALCLFAQTPGRVITPKAKVVLFNGKNLDGWYTWLQEDKYQDPKRVFRVQEGTIKVSGEEWGGLTSKDSYRDYHLTLEWKWGGPNLGKRAGHARDSGILVHGTGEDGAHGGTWAAVDRIPDHRRRRWGFHYGGGQGASHHDGECPG